MSTISNSALLLAPEASECDAEELTFPSPD